MTMPQPVLTGRFLSPFVRRVAVTLNHFEIGFDRHVLSAIDDVAQIERSNPIGRVPALVLSSGETLIDSAAILDHLDEQAGVDRALVPSNGAARRRALYLLAVATGAIERVMTANAERRRTVERRDAARLDRLLRQTRQGFLALEKAIEGGPWFDGQRMMQTDLTTAVGVTFVEHIFPGLLEAKDVPALSQMTARCEATQAFKKAQID